MHYNGTLKISVELAYLYGLERLGVKMGLGVMQRMMEALGHPERKFKSIHVTGTNGKGSICAMLESILRQARLRPGDAKVLAGKQDSAGQAGYTVGLYTSPHLYTFNERIQINRVPIADDDLAMFVQEIRGVCEREHIEPTFFEFTTALAFLYFAQSNIDIAVIEVGMGGLYDATNVITPIISVITNIGLDHTEYFGPTKMHVAKEKAGIIKEGVPVVTNENDPEMLKLFEDEAIAKHTSVMRVRDRVQTKVLSSDLDGQEVEVQLLIPMLSLIYEGEKFTISLPLLGEHQVANMATAIAALMTLERGTLTRDSIIAGIATTKWEGRLDIVSRTPLIIVDGAHNADGAEALLQFLTNIQRFDVLVIAAKKGKDVSELFADIVPLFSHIIVTEGSYMPQLAERIAEQIASLTDREIRVEKNVADAITQGKELLPKEGTMLITGSLYMIADALGILRKRRV